MCKAKTMKYLFILVFATAVWGCSEEESGKDDAVEPVSLTMTMPVTLSGTLVSSNNKPLVGVQSDVYACDEYYPDDVSDNWFDNGYHMSRFLIGVSQAQTCTTDYLIKAVLRTARRIKNKGIQIIGDANSSADDPSHLRYDFDGTEHRVWLYFHEHEQDLPADLSNIPVMYLRWSKDDHGDISGRFVMVFPEETASSSGSSGMARMRVDFVRSDELQSNKIYIQFPADNLDQIDSFRIDIIKRMPADAEPSYTVRGLMTVQGQLMPSLPASETYRNPSMRMLATATESGEGAAVALFDDFAMHIVLDSDGDGDFSNALGDVMLGTYYMDISNRSYFDASGGFEWNRKLVEQGEYINTSGSNNRYGYDLQSSYSWLENEMNLGTAYFTSTCTDSDGADCTAFVQGFFDLDIFQNNALDPAETEPTDTRQDELGTATYLSSTDPDGESGSLVYTVPDPLQ